MHATAVAKPVGGPPGESDYDSVKLIGFAAQAIGEMVQAIGIRLPVWDRATRRTQEITERDFLH